MRMVMRMIWGSRIVIVLSALIISTILSPYDTSSTILLQNNNNTSTLVNWDAVHFFSIAQRQGYHYEQQHAFFPLFPIILSLTSKIIPIFSLETTGMILSNIFFVLAATGLYKLTLVTHHKNRHSIATLAVLFFCIQPSNIFMSVLYSESLTCCLSFWGMYFLHTDNVFKSSFLFGLASAARSNANLLSLYVAYHQLKKSPSNFKSFISHWVYTAVLGIIALGPQILYFAYGIVKYCPNMILSHTTEEEDRPWCKKSIPNITAMYFFIQEHYWNVGFMRYYTWNQVPNFLLALPMIVFAIDVLYKNLSRYKASPYVVHLGFLLLNGIFVAHVQIITRLLLSSCPILYWTPAQYVVKDKTVLSPYGKIVLTYFVLYSGIGVIVFSLFYPWT